MNIFGIQFAPLNVPLERRLQTLATAALIFTLLFGALIGLVLPIYILLFTRFYPLLLFYFVWIFLDRKTAFTGGRTSEWVRNWTWWIYLRDYFPVRLVKTVDLPPNKNYLFCAYPHGVFSSGAFCNFATNANDFRKVFPGLQANTLALDLYFLVPFLREFMHGWGWISASKESIMHVLTKNKGGRVLCLIVGGISEALKSKPGTYVIILKKRKGFVRLALQTGTPLVPVFTFGETDLYDQASSFQNIIKKIIGFTPCIPVGRGFFQYSFGLIPRRHALTTIVGAPINIPKVEKPTSEQIDEYHKKYMDSLTQLFEQHKGKYADNPKTAKLIIE